MKLRTVKIRQKIRWQVWLLNSNLIQKKTHRKKDIYISFKVKWQKYRIEKTKQNGNPWSNSKLKSASAFHLLISYFFSDLIRICLEYLGFNVLHINLIFLSIVLKQDQLKMFTKCVLGLKSVYELLLCHLPTDFLLIYFLGVM